MPRGSGAGVVDVAEGDLDRRAPGEGRVAGEHLVQHDAEAVDVGGGCGGVAAGLLGGHVARRPDDRAAESVLGPRPAGPRRSR